MKASLIIIFTIFSINVTANELDWVNEQIEAIKPSRIGVNDSKVKTLKDPFIFLEKNINTDSNTKKSIKNISRNLNNKNATIKKYKKLTLYAIMNNSVLINAKWYKLYEKIRGYEIADITQTKVLLVKTGKKILLSTDTKNSNLKFKSK